MFASPRNLISRSTPVTRAATVAWLLAGTLFLSCSRLDAQEAAGGPDQHRPLGRVERSPFGLRGALRYDPQFAADVFEVGGSRPHIQVRTEYQILAYARATRSSGLAAWGSWGARILIEGRGARYLTEPEGAFVSPDSRFLALVVRGRSQPEVLVLRLARGGPTVSTVQLPRLRSSRGRPHVEPRSLTLTLDAIFFAARTAQGDWRLYRAPLPADEQEDEEEWHEERPGRGVARRRRWVERRRRGGRHEESVQAETVAGPFAYLSPYLSYSPTAVALLAGAGPDQLDLHVAQSGAPVINVTRAPGRYLEHSPDQLRIAVAEDGSAVAYSLEDQHGPETFYHPVAFPGVAGRQHITADDTFSPYIEQEIFIFFTVEGNLVISAGHDTESMDVYTYDTGEVVNLTQTGSPIPVFVQGTLTIHQVVLADTDTLVVDASGYSGTRGVAGFSLTTGTELFKELGFESVGDFSSVDGDLYFEAITDLGEYRLYRVRSGALTLEAVELAFVRGDANFDGFVDLSDSLEILSYLFQGMGIGCHDAADADDDGQVSLADAVLIQNYLRGGTTPPSPPFPARGLDPTPDSLSCP